MTKGVKTMRSFLKRLAATMVAAAFVLVPGLATAQTVVFAGGPNERPVTVAAVRTAADTAPALYIKYVGDDVVPATGVTTVATVADTSITFVLNGAAYDGFECPVVGALGGIIDTGNAACDTLGEVVDAINSDTKDNFVAFIGAGLRSDVIETTNNLLADGADNDVLSPAGEIIYWDDSVSFDQSIPLWDVTKGVQNFLQPGQVRVNDKSPFRNSDNVLLYGWEQFTTGGATVFETVNVYCVVENYADGSEVATVLYSEPAGATTVYNTFADVLAGGLHCQGGKLFARVALSGGDVAAWNLGLYGYRVTRP
jgi:hypothetical protein